MTHDRRRLDRQLDRVERMLEHCIAADEAARKQRRAQQKLLEGQRNGEEETRLQSDDFYQKLEIIRKIQKETREVMRSYSDTSNDGPKH